MPPFEDLSTEEDRAAALELVQRIASGAWVLFTGAGTSAHSGLPQASTLVERIEVALGLTGGTLDRLNLPRACSRFDNELGRPALVDFLRRELDTNGREPASVHDLLIDLAPQEIFTTNPEDMWERALTRRGRTHRVIVRGRDWAKFKPDELALVKPHGDLRYPDTLIFAEEDYARSLDEIIEAQLVFRLAQMSFLFVGYSVNDEDLRKELVRVANLLGTPARPHFIITNTTEDWRRKQLTRMNVQVIAIGDYSNLERFIREVISEVNLSKPRPKATMIGAGAGLGSLDNAVLAELFHSRYEPIRLAIGEWRLAEAEAGLRELIAEARRATEQRPELGPQLLDFRQRLLLALANVVHWRGRSRQALDLFAESRALGPYGPDRYAQAAIVLANTAEISAFSSLLDEAGDAIRDRVKLDAFLAWQQDRLHDALQWIPPETDDIDLQILKCRLSLKVLEEDGVQDLVQGLEHAWTQTGRLPPAMLEIALISDQLLRMIVGKRWQAPGLDRGLLLRSISERYLAGLHAFEALEHSFPEGLARILASLVDFHEYLGEKEAAHTYGGQLLRVRAATREGAMAEYITGGTVDADTIESLHTQGLLTRAERAVFLSRYFAHANELERAEEVLREALAMEGAGGQRLPILEAMLRLLVDHGRVAEAETLLESEEVAEPEFNALMRGMLILEGHGRAETISFLRSWLEEFPRSRLILENLTRLLSLEGADREV